MTLLCTGKPENLCDSLYCGGLEPSLQCLPGVPEELSTSSGEGDGRDGAPVSSHSRRPHSKTSERMPGFLHTSLPSVQFLQP